MIHSTNRKSKPFNVETVSNLQHCLIPRWYKPANPCSLMLILFLMASLVSSGNAVSYEHAHLVSDTAVNNALPHDAQYIQASKITHDIHHAAYLDKTAVSPELASTHCQQHGMAPRARRQLGGGWGTVTAVDRAQGFYTVDGTHRLFTMPYEPLEGGDGGGGGGHSTMWQLSFAEADEAGARALCRIGSDSLQIVWQSPTVSDSLGQSPTVV